ncbi:hypothetical protein [Streptomyces sp. NPDC051452]|uniref:hypothetical protein n=1 Tax=Streptomyces sp. NPDC051452 TaxID=3365654 RepID=UPI00379CCD3C
MSRRSIFRIRRIHMFLGAALLGATVLLVAAGALAQPHTLTRANSWWQWNSMGTDHDPS